ncbi:MAG TPA: ABC transporter [Myxococcales bacterium]|nr:ABC transporter [Myxococcales bacterium]
MKLSSIPQLYRDANRLTEIVMIMSKYGLAEWISKLQLELADSILKTANGDILSKYSFEERIRMVLTELGPTFIKLGQVLSTRPDLLGADLSDELKKLQSNVPADPPEYIKQTIEEELDAPIEDLFASLDLEAVASASIGQVHFGKLQTGEDIVIKVRHKGICPKIQEDLSILVSLAQLAERIPEFALYQPRATVEEFKRTLERELDFSWELRNIQTFSRNFSTNPKVKIPKAYGKYSTNKILTMEHIRGHKLTSRKELEEAGYDLKEVAVTGAKIFLEMIFSYGSFHADPHPGNFFLLDDNVVGLIDFGMVGRLSERLREDIEDMLMSLVHKDAASLTSSIIRVGEVPKHINTEDLSADITDFVAYYATQSLSEFDISGALNEMMEIIRRYHIVLPAQIGMLIKVLITLEGTSRYLDPDFSLIEVMKPFQQELVARRFSPDRYLKKLHRVYNDLSRVIEILPGQMLDITESVQKGDFYIPLDHQGLEPSVNRVVIGLVTSALFLGSALMLSLKAPPLWSSFIGGSALKDLSLFGSVGMLMSAYMGFRLLRAINRSGHLNREEKKPPFR